MQVCCLVLPAIKVGRRGEGEDWEGSSTVHLEREPDGMYLYKFEKGPPKRG